jgi:hypothetical protein
VPPQTWASLLARYRSKFTWLWQHWLAGCRVADVAVRRRGINSPASRSVTRFRC